MKGLIRDVMFPATGAIGLLVMLATGATEAQDRPTPHEHEAVLASATLPGARDIEAIDAGVHAAAAATAGEQPTAVERRCDRINRIGKFTITRCD